MSFLVVDASIFVAFYTAPWEGRDRVRAALSHREILCTPAHCDAEVASALRGLARRNEAMQRTAPQMLQHLGDTPLQRFPLAPLLSRAWELRYNATIYDAVYVALAENLEAPLLTADTKFSAIRQHHCSIRQL